MIELKFPERETKIANLVEGYFVGGCIRDQLLNKNIYDYDISTPLTPDVVTSILSHNGFTVIPSGEKFGTVSVVFPNELPIEITTFRSETYTIENGRKPDVAFHTSQKGDLMRRDFTINAMAYDPREKELIDPYNGYLDLINKRMEFVSDPTDRIKEDPLRIIRACRIGSYLGFEIPHHDILAIQKNSHELKRIPQERIVNEIWKARLNFARFVELVDVCNIEKYVFGVDFEPLHDLRFRHDSRGTHYNETIFQHLHDTLVVADKNNFTFSTKLGLLYHDIGKIDTRSENGEKIMFIDHESSSERIFKNTYGKMKGTNKKLINEVSFLISEHMKFPRLETINQIAKAVVDWKISGKNLETIYRLRDLSFADRRTTFYPLVKQITLAWEVDRPDGKKFEHLDISKRRDAIRSKWIEDTVNYLRSFT